MSVKLVDTHGLTVETENIIEERVSGVSNQYPTSRHQLLFEAEAYPNPATNASAKTQ